MNELQLDTNIQKEDHHLQVQNHLQEILNSFLSKNKQLSLNGLSKRCAVSEPTLRRIRNGQIKTLPSVTTIVDILTYISKESSIATVISLYPGPVAEFLKEKISQSNTGMKPEYSEQLNTVLEDPVKYLIYKLAANDHGVDIGKINELFGQYGRNHLEELISQDLIKEKDDRYYTTIENYFTPSHDLFVKHFKSVADFIKPHKLATSSKAYSPLFANYSASINKKAYSSILAAQRTAFRKIVNILTDESSKGNIPTFILGAVDTLDSKSAEEI